MGQEARQRGRRPRLLQGRVFSGLGEGAYFAKLDWVKEQCAQKLGFIPYPGTLNLRVAGRYWQALLKLREGEGVVLEPPEPNFCPGKGYPVSVGGINGAIIIPMVADYPIDVVEVMAPVNIRQALRLKDGDMLQIRLL